MVLASIIFLWYCSFEISTADIH